MKRALALLAIAGMCMGMLAGCGGDSGGGGGEMGTVKLSGSTNQE